MQVMADAHADFPSKAYFTPGIIQNLGHSSIRTQLLSVPPWAAAFAFAMFIATVSDRLGHRFIFTLLPQFVALAGFGILFNVHNRPNLEYAALFLAAAGTYSSMPVIVCWFATNRMSSLDSHDSITDPFWKWRDIRDDLLGRPGKLALGTVRMFIFAIISGSHRSLSRWYHCRILFPSPGRTEVQARFQHLPLFHLFVNHLLHCLLSGSHSRKPQTRSRGR